ncbi:type IV secretion system DNA-binding domain-containing protein [Vibrio fluvialis]|nr:type IV secretion system DNA-binding domain-containing protein [Vibrio fluvialis]
MRQWVKSGNSKRVIIIQANSEYEAIGKPLCNAVISFMTKHYLSASNTFHRPTWLFIDEFANLPPNPSVKKWLELSRASGGRSVICTQSLSQIRDIYGEDETSVLLNLLSNVITLRLGTAGDDASYTAKMLSEQTVEVPDYQNANRIGIRSKQLVVDASELTQLRPANKQGVEGYLFIPSWQSVYKLTWPLFTKPAQAKKFIPAKWLLKTKGKEIPTPPTPHNKNPLNKWS